MSACWLLSDVNAKVLNSTEGAHTKSMGTFEASEHLQAPTLSRYPLFEGVGPVAGGTLASESIMIMWED
jgi:hypothetical protein